MLRIPLVLALCLSLLGSFTDSFAGSRHDDSDDRRDRYGRARDHDDGEGRQARGKRSRDRDRDRSAKKKAAAEEESEARRGNALFRGGWGLDYQIRGEDVLTAFRGATIAFRKQVTPNDAWRIALTAGITEVDAGDDRLQADSLSVVRGTMGLEGNDQIYAVTIAQLRYPDPRAEVKFYYGFGPTGSFARTLVTREVTSTAPTAPAQTARLTSYRRSWTAGLAALAGAQWFATPSVSLYAEYGARAVYQESVLREDALVETGSAELRSDSHGFTVGSTGVTLGLAVYF